MARIIALVVTEEDPIKSSVSLYRVKSNPGVAPGESPTVAALHVVPEGLSAV